jgi:23S rRNA (guanine745-N1)-methyltransferase
MLADVLPYLMCPHCGADLALAGSAVRCASGHGFDVARQGYVSLLAGKAPVSGDSADMVAARAEFLDAGHYAPIARAIVAAVGQGVAGLGFVSPGVVSSGVASPIGANPDDAGSGVAGAGVAGPREASLGAAGSGVARPGAADSGAAGSGAGFGVAGGCVADLGAGTGHYLAAVLDADPARVGLALEISKPALRRAARAHPRLGAVGCDAWGRLPVRTGAISVALNVFAPRNPAELERVLAPDGVLVVVSPTTGHLAGLVADLGLLTVAPDKAARIAEQVAPLERSTQDTCEFELALSHAEVLSLVGMGPSAWHIGREALGERVAALPEPVRTTASVVVTAFRRA